MAKIGEGDPRWIVQDRADGQNVNSWHWVEKDVSEWAKKLLTQALEYTTLFQTSKYVCKSTSLSSFEIECTVFNRKGKITFVLESHFTLSWEGDLLDAEGDILQSCKGKIVCPELDHDSDIDKLQLDVSVDGSCSELLDAVRKEGRQFIRSKVSDFFKELKEGHGVCDKKKQGESPVLKSCEQPRKFEDSDASLTEFTQILEWRAPPAEMWETLTDEKRAAAYTRSGTKIDLSVDGSFSFLNGRISGNFISLEKNKKIEMSWRLSDWPQGHLSKALLTLSSEEAGTTLMKLQHTDIPAAELGRTKDGWKVNFWEPIKQLFGFGYDWK